jgi:putative hydrolase of HD superfamily
MPAPTRANGSYCVTYNELRKGQKNKTVGKYRSIITEKANQMAGKKEVKRDRLRRQISFILEIDGLKDVFRRTRLTNGSRRENDAEHSWHISLMALLLSEYADDEGVDIFRSVRMLLIHDIVEIDAGDTFAYDEEGYRDKSSREKEAAARIFALLPGDQAKEFRGLWEEFEERKTPDARFAAAMDVFQPVLLNYETRGVTWKSHGVSRPQVMKRIETIRDGSEALYRHAAALIDDAVRRGYLEG